MARKGLHLQIRAEITGLQPILNKLTAFGRTRANIILRAALRKAYRPLLLNSRATTPKDTGWQKRSMGFRPYTSHKTGVVSLIVGPRTNQITTQTTKGLFGYMRPRKYWATKYAHLIHGGTKPHKIPIKKGRFAGLVINHPGTRPQPWLLNAWNANKGTVEGILRVELWQGIRRELGGP